jgi:hypothetical protein
VFLITSSLVQFVEETTPDRIVAQTHEARRRAR